MSNQPLVSIIIPTYNSSNTLLSSIKSIQCQTYKNIEIIIVDDGSGFEERLCQIKGIAKYKNVKYFEIKNSGPGSARNFGLDKANGKYIGFLDADDTYESILIETAVNRLVEDGSDIVQFDWKLNIQSNPDLPDEFSYISTENFWQKSVLNKEQCEDLLVSKNYFCWTRLYKKDFLIKAGIRFSNLYAYEDNVFYLKSTLSAKKISLIHSPLYNYRIQKQSTTHRNRNSNFHCQQHLSAMHECYVALKSASLTSKLTVTEYHINKLANYSINRTNIRYRYSYVKKALSIVVSQIDLQLARNSKNKLLIVLSRNHVSWLEPAFILIFGHLFQIKKTSKPLGIYCQKSTYINIFLSLIEKSYVIFSVKSRRPKKTIVFLGFDYRYAGNSRFLYEYLSKSTNNKVKFITQSTQVSRKNRIGNSIFSRMYQIRFADVVFLESWPDNRFIKGRNSVWVQLWHGVPFKKLLFDSNEEFIHKKSVSSKNQKYKQIQNWDYILSESDYNSTVLQSAFLLDRSKILQVGFPRNTYSSHNIDTSNGFATQLFTNFKIEHNVTKILLYAPTWRDSGLITGNNSNFHMNTMELNSLLGTDWKVISLNHSFESNRFIDDNTPDFIHELDVQDILSNCDAVVSDYSSIIFDSIQKNIDTYLFSTDLEEYQKYRGLYKRLFNLLKSEFHTNVIDLSHSIKENNHINNMLKHDDLVPRLIDSDCEVFNNIGRTN